jgi:phage repressor protein C with HTH and peptisase S24 domain
MSNKLTISERFLAIREHFKLSRGALGVLAGISGTSVTNIESGATKYPGAEVLETLSSKLDINPAWLLTGQGEMLKSAESDAQAQKSPPYPATWQSPKTWQGPDAKIDMVVVSPPYQNAKRIPAESISLKVLPYLPFRARATFAESFTDDLHKYNWEKAESIVVTDLPDTSEFKEGLVVEVEGDSMETTLRNGSKVLVTPVQQSNWQYMSSGIYCIVYNDSFVIKRVKNNTLIENGLLTLHSDNPEAGSFPVRGNDIRAVWRVRWAVYVPL